ncbi:MAG: SH3 domain-containing protein [Reichenbachiella sp.]|uniref:SH3 domain-containing protein n=1 Tax=Reichenbachiella sp. TaxID=2184521 RepID=UPI0032675288
MTKNILTSLIAGTFILISACSSNKENTDETSQAEVIAEVAEPVQVPAVCIWDKISVRETAGAKGKYVTSLSVGESLSYLSKDSTIEEKTYANVLLNDGKEGWALKSFIVNDAKPAVVLSDISLYSRPDLLTKSDKIFKMMDIIASIEAQGDWMKIKGRRSGAKWMDEGWVKSGNISFDAVDIAGAKFALEALAIEDETERATALTEIINNGDLAGSRFIAELESHLSELTMPTEAEEVEEEVSIEEQATDSI